MENNASSFVIVGTEPHSHGLVANWDTYRRWLINQAACDFETEGRYGNEGEGGILKNWQTGSGRL